ncbi:MAG: hypothetical protein L3J01_01915 [Thiomicrorhabdus sp.]|nr:hypothetical protein [Thiomicrorhabdus sp.]
MLIMLRTLVLSGLVLGLVGCQNNNDKVPLGAQISFDPPSVEWTVKPNYTVDSDDDGINDRVCVISPSRYSDSYVIASMTDADGIPLSDFDVRLHLDLTGNTSSGYPVLKLYDDKNNNGVIDGEHELVNDAGEDGWVKKTNSNGDIHMIVRVNLSCPFVGNLFGFGQRSANSSMSFQVNE